MFEKDTHMKYLLEFRYDVNRIKTSLMDSTLMIDISRVIINQPQSRVDLESQTPCYENLSILSNNQIFFPENQGLVENVIISICTFRYYMLYVSHSTKKVQICPIKAISFVFTEKIATFYENSPIRSDRDMIFGRLS